MTTIKDRLRKLTYSFDSRKIMEATVIPEIERLERENEKLKTVERLLTEDIECLHMHFDDLTIPRKAQNNYIYSMNGRAKLAETKARSDTLEEAARACEGYAIEISGKLYRTGSKTCAAAIRALKEGKSHEH